MREEVLCCRSVANHWFLVGLSHDLFVLVCAFNKLVLIWFGLRHRRLRLYLLRSLFGEVVEDVTFVIFLILNPIVLLVCRTEKNIGCSRVNNWLIRFFLNRLCCVSVETGTGIW